MRYLLTCLILIPCQISLAQSIQKVKELDKAAVYATYTTLNGKVYFDYRGEFYVTDGSESGTHPIKKIVNYPDGISNIITYRNKMIFIANNGEDKELWVSDGTTNGTHMLVGTGVKGTCLDELNGYVYFLRERQHPRH